MSKAMDDAKQQRSKLIDEAQKESEALRANRLEALQKEVGDAEKAIVLKTKQEVFAMARKALADLASTTLEDQIGNVFIGRLRALADPSKGSLRTALTTQGATPLLRSAFELSVVQRAAIQTAVNETFSADIPLRFETKGELVGGIELVASGQKLSWSIADYLGAVEEAGTESGPLVDQTKLQVVAKV
jgi:F-type H+-transporting ATPase subunit b